MFNYYHWVSDDWGIDNRSMKLTILFEEYLYYLSYELCQIFSNKVFTYFTFRCALRHIITLIMAIVCVYFLRINFQNLHIFREHFIDAFVSVLTHEFKLTLIIGSKIKPSLHNSYNNTVA